MIYRVLLAFFLAGICAPAPAATVDLETQVAEFQLENGMTFLLLSRPRAEVLSTVITFRAGGVDEKVGYTGLAHMFEHMAFKGTRHIGTRDFEAERAILEEIDAVGEQLAAEQARGLAADPEKLRELRDRIAALQAEQANFIVKDELWDLYLQNGAKDLNAGTGKDVTSYYVSLPSNRLELWTLMESQRMIEPVFREFYSERDVVAEERLRRTETNPWGKLFEELMGTAYLAHPYGYPTIGWMSDIRTLTIARAREFFDTYYGPNNAVAAVVGDLDVDETARLIERYFGAIPRRGVPPPVVTREPEQKGERRTKLLWDAKPLIMLAFHKPTFPDRDSVALDLLQAILTEGRSSRLYTRLVKESRMASDVYSYDAPGDRYPNLLVIGAVPIAGHSTADIERVILEEIDRIAADGVTERELQKARNNRLAEHWWGLESNMGIARELAFFHAVTGDWRNALRYLEYVEETTLEGIQNAVRKYLVAANRTVGEIETAESGG